MSLFLFSLVTAFAGTPSPDGELEPREAPHAPGFHHIEVHEFIADDHDDEADAAEMAAGRFEEIAGQIGLTDAQRAKVSDIVYASRSQKVDIQARAEKAKLELRRLMVATTLDDKAILKAVDGLNAAEADLRKNKIQLLLSLRKELTAEQWKQLVDMRKERRVERRVERRERRE